MIRLNSLITHCFFLCVDDTVCMYLCGWIYVRIIILLSGYGPICKSVFAGSLPYSIFAYMQRFESVIINFTKLILQFHQHVTKLVSHCSKVMHWCWWSEAVVVVVVVLCNGIHWCGESEPVLVWVKEMGKSECMWGVEHGYIASAVHCVCVCMAPLHNRCLCKEESDTSYVTGVVCVVFLLTFFLTSFV